MKRHYSRVSEQLEINPDRLRRTAQNNTAVVLVNRVDQRTMMALAYARSLRPNHIAALYVSEDDTAREEVEEQWCKYEIPIPLEVVNSPYRDLVDPVQTFLDELDARWADDTITVLIPEFVVGKWWENLLHGQSALALKLALLYRKDTVVISVPYHLD